jgi:hypothetical protein
MKVLLVGQRTKERKGILNELFSGDLESNGNQSYVFVYLCPDSVVKNLNLRNISFEGARISIEKTKIRISGFVYTTDGNYNYIERVFLSEITETYKDFDIIDANYKY